MGNPLLLVAVVLVGGGILLQLWGTYRGWQIVTGSSTRRPRDATGMAGLLSEDLAPWYEELRRLGFTRLGEIALDLPGESRPHLTWLLVDETGTVEVELVGDESVSRLVAFVTTFGDGAVVQTMHPRGERIRRDDFVCSTERNSIPAALERHRREVAAFVAAHGQPYVVASVADHLRHDVTYRERHARRFLMTGFLRMSAKAWLVLAAGVAGVLYLAGSSG